MLKVDEITRCLMKIQAAYPSYKVPNMDITIELWQTAFADKTAGEVNKAVELYIMSDTSGFAPTIGKIRELICTDVDALTEGEAWEMVYKAICNSNYHANEEFNKLPEDVRRAIGGPEQLRAWAATDLDSITVAESNFKRTYRAVAERERLYSKMPMSMRPQIREAPVAAIEAKKEREVVDRADFSYVKELLEKWRAEGNHEY